MVRHLTSTFEWPFPLQSEQRTYKFGFCDKLRALGRDGDGADGWMGVCCFWGALLHQLHHRIVLFDIQQERGISNRHLPSRALESREGGKRKSKCEGFDSSGESGREGERELEPRREGDLLHENEFTMPKTSERYLLLPRRRMLAAGRMNTKDTPAGNGDRRNSAQIRLAF